MYLNDSKIFFLIKIRQQYLLDYREFYHTNTLTIYNRKI